MRRWLPISLCILGTLTGTFGYLQTATPTYESSVRLFVNMPTSGTVQDAAAGVQLTGNLLSSYAQIIQSDLGAKEIRSTLKLSPGAPLPGTVDARVEVSTLLIRVTTTAATPLEAQRLADAAGASLSKILTGFGERQAQSVEVRVIDDARLPTAPSTPRKSRAVLLAFLVGLALGCVAAGLFEALDKKLRHASDACQATGTRMAIIIPRSKEVRRNQLIASDGASAMIEPYRSLRTSMSSKLGSEGGKAVIVTSPGTGEGKTTTISNLALVCAQAGIRTCLVDADLRGPSIHKVFDVKREPGLVDVVLGSATLDDVTETKFGVDILTSGPLVNNASELLNSQRMSDLLERLTLKYDLVLIDTPPILPVTDAAVIAAHVNGVLLVVSHGQTTRSDVEKASDFLSAVGVIPMGLVYNNAADDDSDYKYVRGGKDS